MQEAQVSCLQISQWWTLSVLESGPAEHFWHLTTAPTSDAWQTLIWCPFSQRNGETDETTITFWLWVDDDDDECDPDVVKIWLEETVREEEDGCTIVEFGSVWRDTTFGGCPSERRSWEICSVGACGEIWEEIIERGCVRTASEYLVQDGQGHPPCGPQNPSHFPHLQPSLFWKKNKKKEIMMVL